MGYQEYSDLLKTAFDLAGVPDYFEHFLKREHKLAELRRNGKNEELANKEADEFMERCHPGFCAERILVEAYINNLVIATS